MHKFPKDFVWGVATSAYQIEGAITKDGRGTSIWDTFCKTVGNVANADSGASACDHYTRFKEDVRLMAELGIKSYRFSIAWARIQPSGPDLPNQAGLKFYSDLVDELLKYNIEPTITLYHWDLPQWLQDEGGWQNRSTTRYFADFVAIVAASLSDRVSNWITHNETFEHTVLGHALGTHAPGLQLHMQFFPILHHLLLSHGMAVSTLRSLAKSRPSIGIAQSFAPARTTTSQPEEQSAMKLMDLFQERLHCEPLLTGQYPEELFELGVDTTALQAGDLAVIGQKLDFLGVNYYNPTYVQATPPDSELPIMEAAAPDIYEKTAMGWPVVPTGLTEVLLHLQKKYKNRLPPIYITENGSAFPDQIESSGQIFDWQRINYLATHVRALQQAMEAGVDVRAYFVWTLLDNFEWAEGYLPKFGLVHVNTDTWQRTPKASFHWYKNFIAAQGAR